MIGDNVKINHFISFMTSLIVLHYYLLKLRFKIVVLWLLTTAAKV